MIRLLPIILLLISFRSLGQWLGSEQIDQANVRPWIAKFTFEYQGIYHFGDSESESALILIFSHDKIYGQIRSGYWSEDGKSWMMSYENLKNVNVNTDEFFSQECNGQFITYGIGSGGARGLKVFKPWSGIAESGEYEIGIRTNSLKDFFAGKFIEPSIQDLNLSELVKMSKADLKIMRNEIFARYGLIFKASGEVDKYFRSQEWYRAQYNNVDSFLTELERKNILLIQEAENR